MLAENIKRYRKRLGVSQDQLARRADVTYATLIKLESGFNKNPTIATVKKIAMALKVSIDDLIRRTD